MSSVVVPQYAPWRITAMAFARNGFYPAATFARQLADLANHVAAFRTKEVFRSFSPIAAIPESASIPVTNQRDRWTCAFHSSPYPAYLWVRLTAAQQTDPDSSPYVRVRLSTLTPTTVADAVIYAGRSGSATDTPAFIQVTESLFPSSGSLVPIPADTDLTLMFSDFDNARLVAATVYEVSVQPDTDDGYVDPANLAALGPIYANTRENVANILRSMWRVGSAHLVNWTADIQSTPQTIASDTATNLIDGSSTGAPTAATPGFTINLSHCSRFSTSSSGVRVKMFVLAKDTTDSNGTVQLVDSDNNVVGSVSSFGTTAAWLSATFYLPAAADKYDLQFLTEDGTLSVYAVSLFLYDGA